ncbi:22552_t:CDS:2 [Gigaspora margarita]|uniref:22552_t:CDS:1 n=1 Tax=Gigaspora margarita TaxID=4874 RepID=A0ABM8VZE1_GIGMA|nr:22552_t:CDS:2 [Gigaspora margarita]
MNNTINPPVQTIGAQAPVIHVNSENLVQRYENLANGQDPFPISQNDSQFGGKFFR